MRNPADHFSQALAALFDHRLRTILSILGITIGIAAVMTVSTVSKGGNHLVYSELETFGLNSVWVFRNYRPDSPHRQLRSGSAINNQDYKALQDAADLYGIRYLSPLVRGDTSELRVRKGNRYARAELLGVSRNYTRIVNDTVLQGRNLRQIDIEQKRPVALLAPEVASRLFAAGVNPVGQTIRIGDRRFHVIGLLAGKSRDILSSIGSSGGRNANDRVLVPYTVLQQLKADRSISTLQIEVLRFDQAGTVAQSVAELLERRHRGRYQYSFETMASYIETTERILGAVALIGIIAASISLLVGGMAIMNIMSTAVIERTREIGVRKAVGASERDILWQFLTEATLISVIGGLLGLIIGALSSVILAYTTGFPLTPSLFSIAGALLVSLLVGILSGYLPARRAAGMQPVEALRTD